MFTDLQEGRDIQELNQKKGASQKIRLLRYGKNDKGKKACSQKVEKGKESTLKKFLCENDVHNNGFLFFEGELRNI